MPALTHDRNTGPDHDLSELVTSIRDIGLSDLIHAVERIDGGYNLVQGYRRLSAYRALLTDEGGAWATIPAGFLPRGEAPAKIYSRIVNENIIRKDLSFAEVAITAQIYAAESSALTSIRKSKRMNLSPAASAPISKTIIIDSAQRRSVTVLRLGVEPFYRAAIFAGSMRHGTAGDGSLVILLQPNCPDKTSDGCHIEKDTNNIGAALNFLVEAFERIGRVHLLPMRMWESLVGQYVIFSAQHQFSEFGVPWLKGFDQLLPMLF